MNQEEKYTIYYIAPDCDILVFLFDILFARRKIKQLQNNGCTHTLYNPVLNDNFPEEAAEARNYTDYTKVHTIIFKPQ